MINFVTTRAHRYTLKKFRDGKLGTVQFPFRHWSYERLFWASRVPVATWIFQDIERLSDHESRRAASIAQRLIDNRASVHNHPAYSLDRYGLQRALHAAGINSFETFRAHEKRTPQAWPVFVRPASDHRVLDGTLLNDAMELEGALARWQKQGFALKSLLIIGYRGEPDADGLWRKYSVYRVGKHIIPHHMMRQTSWMVKYGNFGVITEAHRWALRKEEDTFVRGGQDPMELMEAFKAGGITFGRADYGIVQGRREIYEINTNPMIGNFSEAVEKVPELPRQAIVAHANQRILNALNDLSVPKTGSVSTRDINFRRSVPLFPRRRP